MYITVSDTANIPVEFKGSQGQLVVPDTGTFTYGVTQLDGTVTLATQTPTLGAADTETVITLATPTTGTEGTFVLKYQYDVSSTTYTNRITIMVVAAPKYIITENDVRNSVGATDLVLPDEMIDLHQTYLTVKNSTDLGTTDLDAALVGGGYTAQLANQAIRYAAACSALEIMSLTLIKTHTEDNISVTHFEADMNALKDKMRGKYYEAVGALNPALDAELRSVTALFLVVNPDPDVFTGESAT